jgi:RNA polymerase sigma factor (sigma-70 family)
MTVALSLPERTRGPGRKYHHFRNLTLGPMTDTEARDALRKYGRLVTKIVRERRYTLPLHAPLESDDLLSIANVLALQACRDYDPSRGMRLSSWIATLVRQGLGNVVREAFGSSRSQARAHCAGLPTAPPPPAPISLSTPLSLDDVLLVDVIADSGPTAEEELHRQRERAWLHAAIVRHLTPREGAMLRSLLEGETLQTISAQYGVTRQRIEQVCSRSVAKLRARREREERISAVRLFLATGAGQT